MKSAPIPKSADVVIAGAGAAGLYCAYRILKEKPKCRVIVLDKLDRVGGRLQTDLVHIRDIDGKVVEVKDEEGGMRFNQSMTELLALIHSLQMDEQIIPFGMGDDNNFFHVRGRSFTVADSKKDNNAIWSRLYNLQPSEQHKSPVDIITAVYHDLVLSNGHEVPASPTPEFWQQFRLDFKYQGVPLNEWGLWALYRAYGLSQECIQMCADTIGFSGPFYALVSAGEAYQILEDFPANPQFFALKYGFGSLPGQLKTTIEKMGGKIFLNSTVKGVERKGGKLSLEIAQANGTTTVQAEKVILALPATPMQALQAASPALNGATPEAAQLTKNLASVVPTRLSKVNLYYQRAWWRDGAEGTGPCIKNGGSFTSLPMGAVYVFDPIQTTDVAGPAPLTIYSDFTNTNFWETLQSTGPKFTSPLQEKHDREQPQVVFAASQAIVTEATKQLQQMFRMISVPPPVLTSYRLWSDDHPFGFAYHQWARFANDREVMATIVNPAEDIYVCNEAFSDSQGWVNGSLRSANLVLGQGFGLQPLPPAPAGSSIATPSQS